MSGQFIENRDAGAPQVRIVAKNGSVDTGWCTVSAPYPKDLRQGLIGIHAVYPYENYYEFYRYDISKIPNDDLRYVLDTLSFENIDGTKGGQYQLTVDIYDADPFDGAESQGQLSYTVSSTLRENTIYLHYPSSSPGTYIPYIFYGSSFYCRISYTKNGQTTGAYAGTLRNFSLKFGNDEQPPALNLLTPENNSEVDGSQDISFSWDIETYGGSYQGTTLEFSYDNLHWTQLASYQNQASTYSMSSYTFLEGALYWRARGKGSDRVGYGDWVNEVFIVKPYVPKTMIPFEGSAYNDEKQPIQLTWVTINGPGKNASSYEISWKTAENESWSSLPLLTANDVEVLVDTGVSKELSYIVPADTFPVADISWRVRAANENSVFGEWCEEVSFTTIDPIPLASIVQPTNNTWIDEKFAYAFEWSITVPVPDYAISTSELQWKTENGEWASLITLTNSERSYSVPANTFPNGNLLWRVRGYDHDNVPGTWSDEGNFTTVDPLAVCNQLSPNGSIYCSFREPIVLHWATEASTYGYLPMQFDLQWQCDGQDWEDAITITDQSLTNEKSYTIAANTLGKDNYLWRVRAYNHDDVPGEWSASASFYTNASAIPVTTCQPNACYRSSTEAIDFLWSLAYLNDDGTVPSEGPVCELQYGIKGSDEAIQWAPLASNQSTSQRAWTTDERPIFFGTFSTLPDFFIPSPSIYWRVRAYNVDNEPGPWLEASFSTVDDITSVTIIGPGSGGIANITRPLTLSWRTSNIFENVATGIEIQWSSEDVEESYQALTLLDGLETSYTIPSDTFSEGKIYWRIRAYNKDNIAGPWTTSILTFTTGNDGTVDIVPGEIQDDPTDIYTGIKTCKFPGEYFSPGQIYWRVRCYDSEGYIGEYSDTVSFICYGVPKVRNFQSDEKPFVTFTWRATGQVSYEIKIDNNITYGPFHGTDGKYTLPEPLEDGEHLVSIQVQNNLGLLTPWTDLLITVANTPSDEPLHSLSVSGDLDAMISWDPSSISKDDEFLLYRDDTLIKRFDNTVRTYTDRLVLGLHAYKVIQHLPDGYYIKYTHPAVYLTTDTTRISFLEGGPWFTLLLTEERYPTNTFKRSLASEKTKIMGSKYPVIEIGDFEEFSAQYEVIWSFEERELAYQFKKFFGKAVIVKSRGEQVICGVLDAYEMSVNSQTVSYVFTIEQMSIDEDLSIARSVDAYGSSYTNLDRISFGELSSNMLAVTSTNPGITNPQHYEAIAEAINELKRLVSESS